MPDAPKDTKPDDELAALVSQRDNCEAMIAKLKAAGEPTTNRQITLDNLNKRIAARKK